MKKTFRTRSLLLLSAFGFTGGIAAWAQITPKTPAPKMLDEIAGYTSWAVANEEPVLMAPINAGGCRSISHSKSKFVPQIPPPKESFMGNEGPHAKKWLTVYVNSIGKQMMLTQKYPKYPVGTVIVKQKFPNVRQFTKAQLEPIDSPGLAPELLTVMIKREANYDKANGDWEFMVTDGKGEKVTERGKLPSCQGCHKPYEKTDYIVRSYLPASVMKSLKDLDEADTPKSEPAYIEPAK